jgi:hypothetical protein
VLVDSVVDFYSGGRDSEQRTLDEILGWDDGRLEDVHDYIQWLFPSRQQSTVNPFAPLVTDDTVRAFERNPRLRDGVRRAFKRMLRFYGLCTADGRVEIDQPAFAARSRVWLTPGNLNHLRLTRIMESLSTLGLRAEGLALQRCLLEDVAAASGQGRVSRQTIDFWLRAVSAQKE